MNTEQELKALRYLINDLILYVYDLRIKLDSIVPSKRKYTMSEPNIAGDVAFDLFSIPRKQYNDLVAKYGIDTINQACVKLDEFIKINEYIPFKTAYNSLNRKFIKEVLFEQREKLSSSELIVRKKQLEDTMEEINNETTKDSVE